MESYGTFNLYIKKALDYYKSNHGQSGNGGGTETNSREGGTNKLASCHFIFGRYVDKLYDEISNKLKTYDWDRNARKNEINQLKSTYKSSESIVDSDSEKQQLLIKITNMERQFRLDEAEFNTLHNRTKISSFLFFQTPSLSTSPSLPFLSSPPSLSSCPFRKSNYFICHSPSVFYSPLLLPRLPPCLLPPAPFPFSSFPFPYLLPLPSLSLFIPIPFFLSPSCFSLPPSDSPCLLDPSLFNA